MRRVLIIGLDGFTWRIGKRLVQNNHMPTLAKLLNEGCHGTLTSVIPSETSPAWSSFQTGCYPEKTGIFAFHQYDLLTQTIKLNNFREIRVPTLWELLSSAGKKVVSINMPLTSPPPHVNGIIIPGLTCPSLSQDTVYPPDIYDKYLKNRATYEIVKKQGFDTDLAEYARQASHIEQVRCDVAIELMQDNDWDVFSVQVQSTDAFQHPNWWALDPDAAGYSQQAFAQAVPFYEALDGVLHDLIKAAGPSTLTIIVSDHGFCAKKNEIGINTWLMQHGYLCLKPPAKPTRMQTIKRNLKQRIPFLKILAGGYGKAIRFSTFMFAKNPNASHLYSDKVVGHIRQIVDLDRTFAFCLGGMAGVLYLTKPGQREKADEMINNLLEEYGPDSSKPVITEVRPIRHRAGAPENRNAMPDYLIIFAPGVEARISPMGDSVVRSGIQDGKQTGTHERDGVFVFYGPEVTKSGCSQAKIIDIAPTILSYLSIPLPGHMDGDTLNQVFAYDLNISYQTLNGADKKRVDYSDSDQAAVEKQLEDLGYL